MYDPLTSRYAFACPVRGATHVPLSAFRSIEQLPGAAHPAVFRSALVGVTRGGTTEPVLCVELEPPATGIDREKLTRELRELGATP